MKEKLPDTPAAGIRLKELLFQKDAPPPGADADGLLRRVHQLEAENRALSAQAERQKARADVLENQHRERINDLFDQAVRVLKSDDPVEAMGLLQAVLVYEPDHIRAWNNLAVVYSELGYPERARTALQLVLEADPENETAKRNLAILMEDE